MASQFINFRLHHPTPHHPPSFFPHQPLNFPHQPLNFPRSVISSPSSSSQLTLSKLNARFSNLTPMASKDFHHQDLSPTTPEQRTFSWLDMATLWIGLVVGVPSYYLAGSLVDLGMAWWQGIATVVAGNIITLLTLVLTGHPGTKYGISFPVLARASFGIHGSHVPTLLRAIVACGWYGIETWIGGEAIFLLLPETVRKSSYSQVLPWLGTSPLEFACFVVFWFVQLSSVWKGMEGIRELEKYSAPILMLLTGCLLTWAYVNAGGFRPMLSLSSRLSSPEFWSLFFPSVTANISFWAPLALNIPDFTRYAKTQKDQIAGQLGLPIFMGAFSFVGLAVTSATGVIFGSVISDPVQLLGRIGGLTTKVIAILGITLAVVTTNIAANVVASANAVVNLRPSVFTFRQGALLTAVAGAVIQPWRLLRSSQSFVYTWLVGCSALLGPIGGVVLADYYLIRRKELSVKELYSSSRYGAYYYTGGFNLAAMMALAVGMLPVIPGFLQKVEVVSSVPKMFGVIYDNAWFFSFFIAGFSHWALSVLSGLGGQEHCSDSDQSFLPTHNSN